MRCIRLAGTVRAAALVFAVSGALATGAEPAQAWTYKTLYTFGGGNDGSNPNAVIRDGATGNLYGTTRNGGSEDAGTVFKLLPDGTKTVLHVFNGKGGSHPHAGLIQDEAGNLYGTASGGGSHRRGVVFKLTPNGKYMVVHTFADANGAYPESRLTRDSATDDLFGTTLLGGAHDMGTVFKLSAHRAYTIIHSFAGPFHHGDGTDPMRPVSMDPDGNLYGTTFRGGNSGCRPSLGCGIVYKLAPDGKEAVLHAFHKNGKGSPRGGLARDEGGNLYGLSWGRHATVFKIAPDGGYVVLHTFNERTAGAWPSGDLVLDKSGTIYGTTEYGGAHDGGVVFQLDPEGAATVLYNFDNSAKPISLIADDDGNLYGTTFYGGGGSFNGTVFELVK